MILMLDNLLMMKMKFAHLFPFQILVMPGIASFLNKYCGLLPQVI
jgi:hypothetical protein